MTDKLKLLLVDDEVEILNALTRLLRKDFDITSFDKPEEAVEAMKQEHFAIIISDMRMPVLDGAAFLSIAKEISPDTIRILLTGYSDMDSTARAINEGKIYSYVTKPWSNNELKQLLDNASEQYWLKKENRQLTEQLQQANVKLTEFNANLELKVKQRSQALAQSNSKLKLSIEKHRSMFQQILDMVSLIIEDRTKDKLGHNKRVALHSKVLAEFLGWDRSQVINTYIAALVHNVGKVSLPDELLNTPEHELGQQQLVDFQQHASAGADIIQQLPQLQHIAEIIKHQFVNQSNNGITPNEMPVESKLIRIVADYDRLILGTKTGENLSPEDALAYLFDNTEYVYDLALLEQYQQLLKKLPDLQISELDYCVTTEQLEQGMSIAEDILNKNGGILLAKDAILTDNVISKLRQYEIDNQYRLSIYVY